MTKEQQKELVSFMATTMMEDEESGVPSYRKSWIEQEGVLLSRFEGEFLLELLLKHLKNG
jgi:hypothetical protein